MGASKYHELWGEFDAMKVLDILPWRLLEGHNSKSLTSAMSMRAIIKGFNIRLHFDQGVMYVVRLPDKEEETVA